MNRNITATILIILSAGIYFTVTRGLIADAQAVKSVNDQYSSAIADSEKLIAVRDSVLKQYNALSDQDRSNLEKMIPDSVDNIRLIIDLNSVAERHGFSLKDIKAAASQDATNGQGAPAAPAPGSSASTGTTIDVPTLDTVDVSFGVTAPYEQFISFLQDLEASLRIMDVTHITVTANDSGTYDFSVELQTYWLRQ